MKYTKKVIPIKDNFYGAAYTAIGDQSIIDKPPRPHMGAQARLVPPIIDNNVSYCSNYKRYIVDNYGMSLWKYSYEIGRMFEDE